MVKTFPKSRVCVIDVYPMFEEGLKESFDFCKRYNISISSLDGKNILLSYCLNSIDKGYKEKNSIYPKVFATNIKSIKSNFKIFLETHFQKMMDQLPYPYCGILSFDSPDLETTAEKALKKNKSKKTFTKFLSRINRKQP